MLGAWAWNDCTGRPVITSKIRTSPSAPPVTTRIASHCRDHTRPACAWTSHRHFCSEMFQMNTCRHGRAARACEREATLGSEPQPAQLDLCKG